MCFFTAGYDKGGGGGCTVAGRSFTGCVPAAAAIGFDAWECESDVAFLLFRKVTAEFARRL